MSLQHGLRVDESSLITTYEHVVTHEVNKSAAVSLWRYRADLIAVGAFEHCLGEHFGLLAPVPLLQIVDDADVVHEVNSISPALLGSYSIAFVVA